MKKNSKSLFSKISNDSQTYIIAEMSANHGGNFETAIKIIRKAKESGADAVKLQTYRADTITLDSDKEDFLIPDGSPWKEHKTLYSLYEKASTPWEWHEDLFREGKKVGIDVFSSPFDSTAVDFLEELNNPIYKIASPEITDIPLLKKVGATGKPVILSTGIAVLKDLDLAVRTLREVGCMHLAILKCTTAYPTPYNEVNLRTIPHLAETFDCFAGISDHTLGIGVPIAAVALGAKIIEKHFVLDKSENSVDAFFSLTPDEFQLMVEEIRKVESALGKITYELTPQAKKNIRGRRSLYVSKEIVQGETFSKENIKSVRPGLGLHPKHFEELLGKKAAQNISKGERLSWQLIDFRNQKP
jgi:pseudaminic acid synthase